MYLAPDGHEIEIANAAADFLAGAMPIERLHTANSADMKAALRQLCHPAAHLCKQDGKQRATSAASSSPSALYCKFMTAVRALCSSPGWQAWCSGAQVGLPISPT